MAPGHVAGRNPVDLERDDLRRIVLGRERANDSAQRAHPAQRVGLRRGRAPAHRLRPWKRADDRGDDLGDRILRFAARLLDQCDIELALLRVGLDARVLDAAEACALQKALDRRFRRADARALALLARVSLSGGQADDMQREAPRGDEALRALVEQIALDQRVGDEPLQILRRLPLHAGGDFFAEQFEQKVRHIRDYAAPPPAVLSQAAPQPRASSRTLRI